MFIHMYKHVDHWVRHVFSLSLRTRGHNTDTHTHIPRCFTEQTRRNFPTVQNILKMHQKSLFSLTVTDACSLFFLF